jgi:hypothetical protein
MVLFKNLHYILQIFREYFSEWLWYMDQVWDVSEVYMNVFAVQFAAVETNMGHAMDRVDTTKFRNMKLWGLYESMILSSYRCESMTRKIR